MRRLGRDEWAAVIDEYGKSGLSQKDFAARHQVSVHALQFWLYKLRRQAQSSARFLPVSVVASAPSARKPETRWVEAMFPSGLRLRFEVGTDARYLAQLFAAVCS